jgi:hypothetical protein
MRGDTPHGEFRAQSLRGRADPLHGWFLPHPSVAQNLSEIGGIGRMR